MNEFFKGSVGFLVDFYFFKKKAFKYLININIDGILNKR